ncbi:MAG: porin family protein, partial [Muribaculaceae bacterium]|nr:porin family protein [Muribaculaceae bacterium]
VNKRLNLGLEFLMKKVFNDKLDGENLSAPYGIKSSFAKNTDWYSTLTLTISYEFSKRCEVCHYKD